ncbi:MAG TPA: flagellar basal body-associated FliL family protein [Solirubrobacteraceae bacterium]|nr:flagellar basal body-associated FliL family protein [Solirubrobacteraceae bacterium]
MTKKKLMIIVVAALVLAGGAYKTVLAKPKEKPPEPKVHGEVYVLPKEFLVNLADGRYAKVSVALVVEPAAGGGHGGGHGAPTPPEGYGAEPQEAIVRDLITDVLTNASDHELIQGEGREKIKKKILKSIKEHTDVHVEEVLFPDVTVQ